MPVLQFNLNDYGEYLRRLGQERLMIAAKRGALSAAYRAITMMQNKTDQAPPANPKNKGTGGAFNIGQYKRSWKATPAEDGAYLFNQAPYAGVIEEGRRPGAKFPPKEAIVRWAQRRLGLSEKDARAAAFLIARAIAIRGLKARRVLGAALVDLDIIVMEELNREFEKELAR